CLLVWLLATLTSDPFHAFAEFKHLPAPGLNGEPALRRVSAEVLKAACTLQGPFTDGALRSAELPLLPSRSTAACEWQRAGKDPKDILPEAIEEKHTANRVRLAAARIEGSKKQRRVAISPTIQLLDCATLTEEEVCKNFMCTWEAARCHEA